MNPNPVPRRAVRQRENVPPFVAAVRQMLRSVTDDYGYYQFSRPVEDMLTVFGVINARPAGHDEEHVRGLNQEKLQHVINIHKIVKGAVTGRLNRGAFFTREIHQDGNDIGRFDVPLQQNAFQDLVTSYTAHYTYRGHVISKLIGFLSSTFSNEELLESMQGRYPFKILINIDSNLVIPTLVNNEAEFKQALVEFFFRFISQAEFRFNQLGAGVEYVQNAFAGDEIDIDNEADAAAAEFALDGMFAESISMLLIQYSRLVQGRCMPKNLRLPPSVARSLISPNNTDHYCLVNCMLIFTEIVCDEKLYKTITNKTSLNKLENFPIIAEKFEKRRKTFEELYNDEGYIDITPENLEELERTFLTNINIYTLDNSGEKPRAEILFRSTFEHTNVDTIARLLYIPYSDMVPLGVTSNTTRFNLGGKTREDYRKDIANDVFFSDNAGHFCLIPPASSLITGVKADAKYVLCPYCDTGFRGLGVFNAHREACVKVQRQRNVYQTVMRENPEGSGQSFKNFHALSRSPYVIYGDTECRTDPDGHKLFSYMLYAIHHDDPSRDKYIYRCAEKEEDVGNGMVRLFAHDLTIFRLHIRDNCNLYRYMDSRELRRYLRDNKKVSCKFCKKVPVDKETGLEDPELLVVHHDHNRPSPGNIIGYLCQSCNIRERKVNQSFALVFHNLPYDLLALIKILAVKTLHFDDGLTCTLKLPSKILAKTTMRYSTLTLHAEKASFLTKDLEEYYEWLPEIRFIDSYAHLSASLESLVENIAKDSKNLKEDFAITWNFIQQQYPGIAEELFSHSTGKGVIAYSATSIANMRSKTNLPKESYRSDLDLTEGYYERLRETEPEQFEHLQKYRRKKDAELEKDWARSNMIFEILRKHFGERMSYKEYFMYYQKLDVCLLSDVYENYRATTFQTHLLEVSAFIGLPSLSQNAMLYKTGKTLHFIQENLELSKLITANLRGGLSVIINKTAENFTQNPKRRIVGVDISNLYGFAMKLKIANKFLGEISPDQWREEAEDFSLEGDHTYFLLCDVDASCRQLQDRVVQLPPLVSAKKIDFTMLSRDQAAEKDQTYRSGKLCATLENQTDYLMEHSNFLFFTRLGYGVTVKRVFKFSKEYLYSDYIAMNTILRQNAKNEFEKKLWKDFSNIIYGKSLQNNSENTDIEVNSDPKLILKRLINPRLKAADIISDNELVMTNTIPATAKFDTCIQAGFHILEESKRHIYSMIHELILPFCLLHNVATRFILSDTDSLYLEYDFSHKDCPFADYFEYMKAIQAETGIFDMHTFPNHPELFDNSRKKQVGLFLDEEGDSKEILAMVGLCAKSYCYITKYLVEQKDSKGILRPAGYTETTIKGKGVNNRYLQAAYTCYEIVVCSNGTLSPEKARLEFANIQRKNYHNVTTVIAKNALSSFDDKVYHWRDADNVWRSLPHGHYLIREIHPQNPVPDEELEIDE